MRYSNFTERAGTYGEDSNDSNARKENTDKMKGKGH